MEGYYETLRSDLDEPTWSGPYNDAAGFGMLYTVSMPVYFKENGSNKLIGVAGIDIKKSYMMTLVDKESEIEDGLRRNTATC